jgi:Ser/Thr protein kinase RdoA (MazF antagonist)
MEARIKERYDDAILQEAMRRYGIAGDQIHLLDGFESFIYEYERGGEPFILRLAHSIRRSESLIQGEVDWINHLAAGGASVARAVRSEQGNLVEGIDDGRGGCFLSTAFVKARGKPPGREEWNEGFFQIYGQLLGRMHALTRGYRPADPSWQRPHWDDPEMLEVERLLPGSQVKVRERYRALMEHLHALPTSTRSYGLIHQDAHAGNLFVDGKGTTTLFDFDDCAYSWFTNDVAIVLFYAVMGAQDAPAFTRTFMAHFLQGYRQEDQIDAVWLKEIPHFLKLREIDLYAVIHRSFDVDNLDDPWCANYMQGRRQKIEDDVPYIEFDFESLAEYL